MIGCYCTGCKAHLHSQIKNFAFCNNFIVACIYTQPGDKKLRVTLKIAPIKGS